MKVGQPANLPPTTTSIVVANYVGFNTGASWVLDKPFARLETLEVGNNCFLFLTTVSIRGLPRLASVVIGEKSFSANRDWKRRTEGRPDTLFEVAECPQLRRLWGGVLVLLRLRSPVVWLVGARGWRDAQSCRGWRRFASARRR